ncbi:MAG: 2-oxoacid:acceptor oxidoreductase subunit alpha [Desulfuromonadaceae bacterium]|nr:2-oxoacid:acceptor oxidoreductase subunit alpha [Desulfuromonadaceae bacterium]
MNGKPRAERGELAVVLAGEAGQGVQAVESLLSEAFRQEGYYVFSGQEFMSRIRGGSNSSLLRVSGRPVRAWSDRTDICVAFDEKAVRHLAKRLQPETYVLGDGVPVGEGWRSIDIPLRKLAKDAGESLFVNTISAGILWGILSGRRETIAGVIRRFFSGKKPQVVDSNLAAAEIGMKLGQELKRSGQVSLELPPLGDRRGRLSINGTEAVSLGAIAGGCNFVSAYPMSPSTGVLVFLAKHGRDFGIIVEQAEDEISAANMVLGAWYAGARGMTTTSGGGFDLMTEAVSLSGMTETPMVVHLAQRPGPATGLPTRTEQGDLNLALYGGHGEFPRVLLAPGNLEQAYALAREAFHLADAFQVPVILLTDQYLMDSRYDVDDLPLPAAPAEAAIVQTGPEYGRYAITESGVSPRGIPGWGEGLVGVDSDEHDESGHITEDLDLRVRMVDKRLRKLSLVAEKALSAEWIGPEEAPNVVVCWGTALEIAREAVAGLGRRDLAVLHFRQVFPLPEEMRRRLEQADCRILLEGNATGQFGELLRQCWGIDWQHRILKYNGLMFSIEEVRAGLRKILPGEEVE